jgi:hypothetical protein
MVPMVVKLWHYHMENSRNKWIRNLKLAYSEWHDEISHHLTPSCRHSTPSFSPLYPLCICYLPISHLIIILVNSLTAMVSQCCVQVTFTQHSKYSVTILTARITPPTSRRVHPIRCAEREHIHLWCVFTIVLFIRLLLLISYYLWVYKFNFTIRKDV